MTTTVHRHRVQCLLMNSCLTMTCDGVARQMCCSMADHTFGRVPNMVTKSLCPDGSFHTMMMMHNWTETVKRNLNFESDWLAVRGGVFVKHRTLDQSTPITFNSVFLLFNSFFLLFLFVLCTFSISIWIIETSSLTQFSFFSSALHLYAPSRNTFSPYHI